LPQVNPATLLLLLAVAIGIAWVAGGLRLRFEDGRLAVRVWRSKRALLSFELRDIGLLLALALVMGWAVAAAVEHTAWVPGTEGKLVPAIALATFFGWLLASARASRLTYFGLSALLMAGGVALLAPSPLNGGVSMAAFQKWLAELPAEPNPLLLAGLLLVFLGAGFWTSWWVFRRRNGLVALLPTGTILAVEIVNDVSSGVTVFTVLWLAAAAGLLLRINYVSLKLGWRLRRVPRASDTGWTFGEVGIEATALILLAAFILLPPLSSSDISGSLIPSGINGDPLHPFGLGSAKNAVVGSIGYSEVVRPGSQLKAKSQTVMIITGDTAAYYPYWRGIALGGWDGISWYELPSTPEVPVRQQPVLAAHARVPRDDLPADSDRSQILHNSFRVVVGAQQTLSTVFSAGEIVSVDNQSTTLRGIMTSVPSPVSGPGPALVNVAGDSSNPASFDTVDHIRFLRRLQPPYNYSLTETVPIAGVADLQAAGTSYPDWLAPYRTLYYNKRTAAGYTKERDVEIQALAQSIVRDAGATNPFDQAKAIESWFRAKNRFTYTLNPPAAPAGERPLDYFLFTSKKGFCQDFSTAMNVMLRMLGIPSRQMSGFGEGVFDEKTHQWFVNSLDAHSWVEVYFPGSGWIPFEPTPADNFAPVNRPASREAASVPPPVGAVPTPRNVPGLREPNDTSVASSETGFDIRKPLLIGLAVLLLLAIGLLLFLLRWLMAVRDLPRIWRRLLFLGDRLKVPRLKGDTPQEFGSRLAGSVPNFDPEVRRLAALYTRASFRRGGLDTDELAEARRAWRRIRGGYAGLVARAWRDALRHGRVIAEPEVSEAEAAASESRSPSARP
jgi:transglutaminase-like putative cysteine protease